MSARAILTAAGLSLALLVVGLLAICLRSDCGFGAGSGVTGRGPGVPGSVEGSPQGKDRAGPSAGLGRSPGNVRTGASRSGRSITNRTRGLSGRRSRNSNKSGTRAPHGSLLDGSEKRPADLVVLVEDENASPVGEVSITLSGPSGKVVGTTGDDGGAVFSALAQGTYSVRLQAPDRPPLRGGRDIVLRAGQEQEVVFELTPVDKSITGRVLDSRGNPLAGMEVRVSMMEKRGEVILLTDAEEPAAVTTDAAGSFVVSGLAVGEFELAVTGAEGYAPLRQNVMSPATGVDIVLHVEKTLVVSGQVTDDGGVPLPDVVVSATGHRGQVRTAGDGTYRFEVTMKGASGAIVTMAARKDGYLKAETPLTLDAVRGLVELEISFELESLGALAVVTGRIVDDGGDPVAGESVHLRSAGLNALYHGLSGADGKFRIADVVVADDYRLWVYPQSGYRDRIIQPVEIGEGENRVAIILEVLEAGALSGVLLDAKGKPVPRFTFRVRSTRSFLSSAVATTDDAGRFDIESVPAGNLVIETRTLPRIQVHGIQLRPDEEKSVEIPVGIGESSVEGRVVSTEGAPVTGARVAVTWTSTKGTLRSNLTQETVTNDEGHFVVKGLAVGSCRVSVTAYDFEPARSAVTIPSQGRPRPVKIEMSLLEASSSRERQR